VFRAHNLPFSKHIIDNTAVFMLLCALCVCVYFNQNRLVSSGEVDAHSSVMFIYSSDKKISAAAPNREKKKVN
jgi:hypothetical protein